MFLKVNKVFRKGIPLAPKLAPKLAGKANSMSD